MHRRSHRDQLCAEWKPRRAVMIRAPRLLIPWESRLQSFQAALKPALARSKPPLGGECSLAHHGTRSTICSVLLHASIVAWIVWIGELPQSSSPRVEPALPENATIVYYSGAFPAIQDGSGAAEGSAWSKGGRALHPEGPQVKFSASSDGD